VIVGPSAGGALSSATFAGVDVPESSPCKIYVAI